VPDTWDGDGRPIEDTPAYVVREIFDRIAAGDAITRIRKDLNERGIVTKQGFAWENSKVLTIATNPTYIGARVHQGEILEGVSGFGPPLVDEGLYSAVQKILTDPARRTTRLGPRTGTYLLSSLARCAECGGKLTWKKAPANNRRTIHKPVYWCPNRSCVGIYADALDEYVSRVVVRWLSDPQVAADLTEGNDSDVARQARIDADRAKVDLEEWRRHAEKGEVSVVSFSRVEKGLLERINEAERLAQAASLPPVFVGNVGPQAQAGWDALDMLARRQIVRTIAEVRLKRVGRGGRVPTAARVEWIWKLGREPDNEMTNVNTEDVIRAAEAANVERLAHRAAKVAHLRAEGWTRQMIADEIGVSVATVNRDTARSVRWP
jgi:site-specific DNA recombinase